MLFRMKFRFTNQQLLYESAAVIGMCSVVSMSIKNGCSVAGASGYGLYTFVFQYFMADNMSHYGAYLTLTSGALQQLDLDAYIGGDFLHSMMSVTLKQIFGQVIWVSGITTMAFLLLDIRRVRTSIEKVLYWPVCGLKFLSRLR